METPPKGPEPVTKADVDLIEVQARFLHQLAAFLPVPPSTKETIRNLMDDTMRLAAEVRRLNAVFQKIDDVDSWGEVDEIVTTNLAFWEGAL